MTNDKEKLKNLMKNGWSWRSGSGGSGGSGGGATPDWNQNDETAPDYVKNRICYDYNEVETNIINDREIEFSDGYAEIEYDYSSTSHLLRARIVMDGIEYDLDVNEDGCAGNLYLYNPENEQDTGEPFCIYLGLQYNYAEIFLTSTDSTTHVFSINVIECSVVKLPQRYIPNDYLCAYSIPTNEPLDYVYIPTSNEETSAWGVMWSGGILQVVPPGNLSYIDRACTAVTYNQLPTNVGEHIVSTSKTTSTGFCDFLRSNYVREFHYAIELDNASNSTDTIIIPAQITKSGDMFSLKGQYVDSENKVYVVNVVQTGEPDQFYYAPCKCTITRII